MKLQTVLSYCNTYDFHNTIFKIKHKLCIASGSFPPPTSTSQKPQNFRCTQFW